ncbi:hypothetical protein GCM10028795_07260 [Lysobacter olei]
MVSEAEALGGMMGAMIAGGSAKLVGRRLYAATEAPDAPTAPAWNARPHTAVLKPRRFPPKDADASRDAARFHCDSSARH